MSTKKQNKSRRGHDQRRRLLLRRCFSIGLVLLLALIAIEVREATSFGGSECINQTDRNFSPGRLCFDYTVDGAELISTPVASRGDPIVVIHHDVRVKGPLSISGSFYSSYCYGYPHDVACASIVERNISEVRRVWGPMIDHWGNLTECIDHSYNLPFHMPFDVLVPAPGAAGRYNQIGLYTFCPGPYYEANGIRIIINFLEDPAFLTITAPDGSPIGAQIENHSFPVKIEGFGSVAAASGPLFLTSSSGVLYTPQGPPTLVDGSAVLDVKLFGGGKNVTLTAFHDSPSGTIKGTSNVFSVGSGTGHVGGKVTDPSGDPLKDVEGNPLEATVELFENTPKETFQPALRETLTSEGLYEMADIDCGSYQLKAKVELTVEGVTMARESKLCPVEIPCDDRHVVKDLVIPNCNSCESLSQGIRVAGSTCNAKDLTPILLVGGIFGSHKKGAGGTVPRLPKHSPRWNEEELELFDPYHHVGWGDLISDLENRDYKLDCTLFAVPYDWRMEVPEIATEYLMSFINWARITSGKDKVMIVAHSMGGLVSRSYIQSDNYHDDVAALVMAATPNKGAANPYYLCEGGDTRLTDRLNSDSSFFYTNVLEGMSQDIFSKRISEIWKDEPNQIKLAFGLIRNHLKSGKHLLPTYDVLYNGRSVKPIIKEKNKFLKALNSSKNIDRFIRSAPTPDQGEKFKVPTYFIVGTGQKTIQTIKVGKPHPDGKFYQDGIPIGDPIYTTQGDGTVLEKSVLFLSGPEHVKVESAHGQVVKKARTQIVNYLLGPKTSSPSPGEKLLEIQANGLSLTIDGSVQGYIVSPGGEVSGITGGMRLAEIPESSVNFANLWGNISFPNAPDGTYSVHLTGVREEDFLLTLEYGDPSKTDILKYHGFSHAGKTISYSFTINSASRERLTVEHTPLPPQELEAEPYGTPGSLKTRLNWIPPVSGDTVSYRVYTAMEGEPYLSLVGSPDEPLFDTPHPWKEISEERMRIYVVSAVMADGTESFLSEPTTNDDRDSDGLTDIEEEEVGSDLENPDTDGDGLNDGRESLRGTDPLLEDTDGDGCSDFAEVESGTDPLDPASSIDGEILTISKTGSGSGKIVPDKGSISWEGDTGTASYGCESTVTLTATASSGSLFTGWSGACTGTGKCTVTMDQARTVTATFNLSSAGIHVSYPNGGEILKREKRCKLQWTYKGTVGTKAKVELMKGSAVSKVLSSSAPMGKNGAGFFNWKVPSNQALSANYKIRVTSTMNKKMTDTSDAPFRISR